MGHHRAMPAKVAIRHANVNDARAVQAIYAPFVEGTVISFEETPPSIEELAARIASCLDNFAFVVAERGGRIIGYAYGGRHRSRSAYRFSVDVSVYVAEEGRGAGVGRALYDELLPILAKKGFHAAFAGIALPNPASIALHRALGFEQVGIYRQVGFKFGRWHDVAWWQCLLNVTH